jgi:hypothetical protein
MAGRIVDEDQERAAWPASLEPLVMRPIDLDRLREPRPPLPDLEHALVPPAPRLPRPETDLDLPHRLGRHPDTHVLAEFLRSQRRPEGMALAQRDLHARHRPGRQTVVRRLAAAAGHQTAIATAATREITCARSRSFALISSTSPSTGPSPNRQQKGDISTLQEGDI